MAEEKLISWSRIFTVNVKEIDDQHKKLFELINKLHAANQADVADQALQSIFDELIEYTQYHFDTEEKLMLEYKFPGYEDHKREHENLKAKVFETQEKYLDGKTSYIVLLTLELISSWINKHLLETDKKYSEFFTSKGLK